MARMRGFTLIEVLVALLIVSILASIAWPNYAAYLTKTRRMEGKVALIMAMEQHHALHHSYVAFSSAAPVAGLPWWSGTAAGASYYELDAEACPARTLRDCVQLRASPGTANVDVRFRDAECGTLTLLSTGEQGASGPSKRCWP